MDPTAAIEQALARFDADFRRRFEGAGDEQKLREERAAVLKKGGLQEALKQMGALPPERRKAMGERVNALKSQVDEAFNARLSALARAAREAELSAPPHDLTLPARVLTPRGHLHPLTQVR